MNQSAHAADAIVTALAVFLGANSIPVDDTSQGSTYDGALPFFASQYGRVNYNQITGLPANHAVYTIGNNSFTGFYQGNDDTAVAFGVLLDVWAYTGAIGTWNALPPVLASSVARIGVDASALGCEFGVTPGYKGLDTSTLSAATPILTAALASIAATHPAFNLADVKAAMRQTAANWATGFDPANYGYGAFNFDAANVLPADPRKLYLQTPYMRTTFVDGIHNAPAYEYTLYPYLQTRRALDRIFAVPAGFAWGLPNELNNTMILEAGGIEIASNNTRKIMNGRFLLDELPPGTYELVCFTCDANGNFSRVDPSAPVVFNA